MQPNQVNFDQLQPRIEAFEKWLEQNGCTVQDRTNAYEVVRFRAAPKAAPSIVYRRKNGALTWTGDSWGAFKAFHCKQSWAAKACKRASSMQLKPLNDILLERDGHYCALCGEPLDNDITREHWVPVSTGGTDHPNNLALMHEKCNQLVSNMPVTKKLEIRDVMRGYREPVTDTSPPF